MRQSDILVLPSIEEGFGLVCTEAMASGCVPLVSVACTEICGHFESAVAHEVGEVEALADHITLLHGEHEQFANLRAGCLRTAQLVTWRDAGLRLLEAYREVIAAQSGPLSATREAACA